jgi:hypothetical protein
VQDLDGKCRSDATAHTSQKLSADYADLVTQVQDTITVKQIQSEAMFGTTFDSSVESELEQTRIELAKRQALAAAMGSVAAAQAALAGPHAAADIGAAVSGLAKQCEAIHQLPRGAAIPDVGGQAGQVLMGQICEKKVPKSSAALGEVAKAIATKFEAEKPLYESINAGCIKLASEIARHHPR